MPMMMIMFSCLVEESHELVHTGNYYKNLIIRKPVFEVSDPSDTNQTVQPQKMARGLELD